MSRDPVAISPGGAVVESNQTLADDRFVKRLEETGARDPREYYRTLLRDLKAKDADAYTELVEDYQAEVVAPIARGEGDPVAHWLDFGARVAGRLHPGKAVVIEDDGRSRPFAPPGSHEHLILHLPDEPRARAIPVGIPVNPTPAQHATLELLVKGKTRLEQLD